MANISPHHARFNVHTIKCLIQADRSLTTIMKCPGKSLALTSTIIQARNTYIQADCLFTPFFKRQHSSQHNNSITQADRSFTPFFQRQHSSQHNNSITQADRLFTPFFKRQHSSQHNKSITQADRSLTPFLKRQHSSQHNNSITSPNHHEYQHTSPH